MTIKPEQLDALESQIKKQQEPLKREHKPQFMSRLREILDLAFMMPKQKKEHFITKEKLTLEILRLVQSQKKFKSSENIFSNILYLAVLDEDNIIGKLIKLNPADKTAEYATPFTTMNNLPNIIKPFSSIRLFDYNSIAMEVVFDEHKKTNGNMTYRETYSFLSKDYVPNDKVDKTNSYGSETSEQHPVMAQVIEEYGIPFIAENKSKKKTLFKLCPTTEEILEEYETVQDAMEKTGISSKTISNVLCQGESAVKYLVAGGFKWQYSNAPNTKYLKKAV